MRTLLIRGLKELDIKADEQQCSRLLTFVQAIEKGNSQVNLVKATGQDLIVDHILDSLTGLKLIKNLWADYLQNGQTPTGAPADGWIADTGSGAGLPGIPLALFMPEARFTLIENSPRKATFLKKTAELLKLPNIRVCNQDIQTVTQIFPLVIFRAFTPLQKEIFRSVFERLAPGGRLVAYKGRQETINEELKNLSPALLARLKIQIITVQVPFSEKERHLIVLYKTH